MGPQVIEMISNPELMTAHTIEEQVVGGLSINYVDENLAARFFDDKSLILF
jgi:hypothetical protein